MATIKKPIRIGDDTPLRNFQTDEAVGPDHGGTGLVTSDLAGQAGKVLAVNGTEDGYTLTTGGGGGGVESVTGSGVDNTDTANPVVNARPYQVYTALLSQSGTDDPTVIVLENTTGETFSWTRLEAGRYVATIGGDFTLKKTAVFSQSFVRINVDYPDVVGCYFNSPSELWVVTGSNNSWDPTQDGVLNKYLIEVRIYNPS